MTDSIVCNICSNIFTSRNKLFSHIKLIHTQNHDIHKLSSTTSGTNDNLPYFNNSNGVKSDEVTVTKRAKLELSDGIESNISKIKLIAADEEWYQVILKPQGLPTMGEQGHTVLNSDLMLLPNRIKYKKAVPCHRLDKSTGGLLLCSKNKQAEIALTVSFRRKQVRKLYTAIVIGKVEHKNYNNHKHANENHFNGWDHDYGIINSAIGGQDSVTYYKVIHHTKSLTYNILSTLLLWPITGKKHQLRKHLQSIGHPIVGDKRYSSAILWPTNCDLLFLWSICIDFPHPKEYYNFYITDKMMEKNTLDENNGNKIIVNEANDTSNTNNHNSKPDSHVSNQKDMNMNNLTYQMDESLFPSFLHDCFVHTNINIPRVMVQIPEPYYFHEFRVYHENLYHNNLQNNTA
eukprot:gene10004-13459_t